MAQAAWLVASFNSLSTPPTTDFSFNPGLLPLSLRNCLPPSLSSSFRIPFSFISTQVRAHAHSPLLSTPTLEAFDTSTSESEFIEVGYLSSVHGLQGEICIKPSTDFPELRYSRPGKRWLKQLVLGKERFQEVELVEGREHLGKKSWILKFQGINNVDEAKKLIGSALLVREEDRPDLEEDEFYTHDLVGMRVLLKETGEAIGTVISVYDSGASDLLHVMLDVPMTNSDSTVKSKPEKSGVSNHLVWVPFVEAIVPYVDIDRREMLITPPKGLLELNLRSHTLPKKERRQLEWKERKRFQKRLIAAKKKLCELDQKHVFHGLRYGEKSQRSLLADQIVGVNSKLLQQVFQNDLSCLRWNVDAASTKIYEALKTSENYLSPLSSMDKQHKDSLLKETALHLMSEGKVAIVLVGTDDKEEPSGTSTSAESFIQKLEIDNEVLVKVENRASVPLVMICPAGKVSSFETLFSDNDYFGFNSEKVWFLEEVTLPVVACSLEERKKTYKILMKSPWEMLQSPIGSGGIISLLSFQNIVDNLSEMGVHYVEICTASQQFLDWRTHLLGFVHSRGADVGLQISEDKMFSEESFDLVLSMNYLKTLMKDMSKMQFHATLKSNGYVELVDKEWVDVFPTSPNSYEVRSSVYSYINGCSLDKVCLLKNPA